LNNASQKFETHHIPAASNEKILACAALACPSTLECQVGGKASDYTHLVGQKGKREKKKG
jgi:hypothetical protein